MAVSTVTLYAPPEGVTYPDPGVLRPTFWVAWTGGVGPFDVQIQVDDDQLFGSTLIDNTDLSVTSPHSFTAGVDLGLAGPWYWRARVRDQDDAAWSDWTNTRQINYFDPIDATRYLYLLAKVGVAFDPIDISTAGPADDDYAADGFAIDQSRFLYLLAKVGVGHTPIDDPAGGWGTGGTIGPDGFAIDQSRFLYLLAKVGVGFDPTDTPIAGWDPEAIGNPLIGPGDGYTENFTRYLYLLANVDTSTPTPHIWYLFPTFGREGWEFRIVGYGFGDTQATYSGSATLSALAVSILSWELVAEVGSGLEIDPITNTANPVHQLIRAVVPEGAESGLVIVCTDGP